MRSLQISKPKGPLEMVERDMPLSTPILRFGCARRTPECPPRIDPIWIELQHLVVELLRGCRHFGYLVEIADILPGLLDDPGIVVVTRSLMCGDNGAWVERLNFV
jgi:hypothetical protein